MPGSIRRSKLPWVALRGNWGMWGCPNPRYTTSCAGLLSTRSAFYIFACRLSLSIAIHRIPFGVNLSRNLLCIRRVKVVRMVHRKGWIAYEWGTEGLYNYNTFGNYPEHFFSVCFQLCYRELGCSKFDILSLDGEKLSGKIVT